MNDFVETNRANWDERVPAHVEAYGAIAFADDPDVVSGIVQADYDVLRPLLPASSVRGLTLAHLQCHIGTDTLSWARLGAQATGIDFSPESIRVARELAERAGVDARFETCTVDEAPGVVKEQFDVVYTSVGVLMWLPRLDTWAHAIHSLLKPGGTFYVRDAHPVLNAIDYDRTDGLLVLKQPYFESDEPTRYDHGTTYADDEVRLANSTTFEWSHSLSEIIQSLLTAGLRLEAFHESKTIPWRALPSFVESSEGYVHPGDPNALPLEFSLVARKP